MKKISRYLNLVDNEFLMACSINELIDEVSNLNNKTRLITERLDLIEKEMKKIDSKTNHI